MTSVRGPREGNPPDAVLHLTGPIEGLARIVSIALVGLPHAFFLAMTVLEMGLPVIVAFMQLHVARAAQARQAAAADQDRGTAPRQTGQHAATAAGMGPSA